MTLNTADEHQQLRGIMWILFNHLIIASQSAFIKHLSTQLYHAQLLFLYKLTLLVFMLSWFLFREKLSKLRIKHIPLLILRSFIGTIAGSLMVYALHHAPLNNSMAISFTEPLFSTLLAALIFKERLKLWSVVALIAGFAGAVVVIQPKIGDFNVSGLVVVIAAFCWGIDNLVVKKLGKGVSKSQYLFYVSLFSTMFAAPRAFMNFDTFEFYKIDYVLIFENMYNLLMLATLYFIHVIAVFRALQCSGVSVVAPFAFTRLIFAAIIDYTVFKCVIEKHVVIGSLIIIASAVYLVWDKDRGKRAKLW